MKKEYKIVVVGLGYVGLSNAILLAQQNQVVGVDISEQKVEMLNERKSPISDPEISDFLKNKELNLYATTDLNQSILGADFVIIATPTDYDEQTDYFDTSSVETVIATIVEAEIDVCIVVKSTIPVGFIDDIRARYNTDAVIFSPEFLREGSALYDNLHPSRIVVGEKSERAKVFAELLEKGALKTNIEVLFTGTREAEAIKLFANTYLAMRVAFFNELDSYALSLNLDSREIISGISLDARIGDHYNNPSFGYGGYCLPKDTKQLLANYKTIPQNIIQAVVASNSTRKEFVTNQILNKHAKIIGIYRLQMKHGSDNFRNSAIKDIIEIIKATDVKILIYEPEVYQNAYYGCDIEQDLKVFKSKCDIIVANRMCDELLEVNDKVFTRDIFGTG